jgi:hypothetical protein
MRDDSTTRDADTLKVQTNGRSELYLSVATTQVPQIQLLFDSAGIMYTIESQENEMVRFVFHSETDAVKIQSLLDGMH